MSNENKAIDYSTMLADLYAKRAGIDAAIAGIMAASGGYINLPDAGANNQFATRAGSDHQPTELPRGAFLNKSLPAAVKLYLSAVMKKQTIKEIATALRDGGVESTSDNFEGVITGCLNRMKTNGEILRFDDGWALAEFYPARLRSSLTSAQDGTPKRVPAKKSASKKKGKNSPKPAKKAGKSAPGEGLDQRVEAFTRSRHGDWITFKDVMGGLPDLSHQAAATALGRVAKARGWERSKDGEYHVGSSNLQEMPKAV